MSAAPSVESPACAYCGCDALIVATLGDLWSIPNPTCCEVELGEQVPA